MDKLRNFLKHNKGNMLLLCAAIALYLLLFAVTAQAEEPLFPAPHCECQAIAEFLPEMLEAITQNAADFQTVLLWHLGITTLTLVFLVILIIAVIWRA
jgi:Trk-type K+ transport system membrane component